MQSRQVSTRPEKINEFFQRLTRERLREGESFAAVLEVSGFGDWLITMLRDYRPISNMRSYAWVTHASAYMPASSRIQIVVENTPEGISTRSLATPRGWTNRPLEALLLRRFGEGDLGGFGIKLTTARLCKLSAARGGPSRR